MDKEAILKKSRQDNRSGDERVKSLEQKASQNAYLAIMIIFLILGWISFIQEIVGYRPFADYRIISMTFCISLSGNFITKYKYERQRLSLYIGCGGAFMAILQFFSLLMR